MFRRVKLAVGRERGGEWWESVVVGAATFRSEVLGNVAEFVDVGRWVYFLTDQGV
ncbi:MAG: hypothetical protein N2595_01455 [bacterium]|nr:hypothetical protein [bacterium]